MIKVLQPFSRLMIGLFTLLGLGALDLFAQTPAGEEIVVNSRRDYIQAPNSLDCDDVGSCAVVWSYAEPADVSDDTRLFAASFGPHGGLMAERELRVGDLTTAEHIVGLEAGFTVFWDKNWPRGEEAPVFQEYSVFLEPRSQIVELPHRFPEYRTTKDADRTVDGYAVLWQGRDLPQSDPACSGCEFGPFLSFFDRSGHPLGDPLRVHEDLSGYEDPGGLAFGGLEADEGGHISAVFSRTLQAYLNEYDVYFRRFSPSGEPLGPEIRVNEYLPGDQRHPDVATGPDGRSLVVWQSDELNGGIQDIYARLFSAEGKPMGPEFRVNNATESGQRFPSVAADPHGNFIVVWRSFVPGFENGIVFDWEIKGRLLRPDGTPVAGEIFLNQERHFEQGIPLVAFAANGTFFAAWGGPTQATPGSEMDVHARRFAASPGEEPCAVSGSKLLCDTGRTGGEPELALTFGGRPGEVTLLGDWDGDGREDICAWRAGRFRCDLDHEGPPAEAALAFGFPTDTPLLGDVDGDGRAEPCVRRKRRLLCDTGHNGGRAETVIVLGRGSEIPLLGDLDGDGRDDLCLAEKGQWTCLTRAGSRVSFAFGGPEESPALGDLDRDGRADPCVLSGGTLLCDTAHDGGAAEGSLALTVPPGARPIFGNLDGL